MKKLFALLFVFLFAASATFAYNGGTTTASGSFTCKVIAPLSWTKTANIDLGVVIADGNPRTSFLNGNSIAFTLTGEATYGCMLTLGAPAQVVSNTNLTLVGAWTGSVPLSVGVLSYSNSFPLSATQTYTYTVASVTAATGAASGTTVYTLPVSAVYTGI